MARVDHQPRLARCAAKGSSRDPTRGAFVVALTDVRLVLGQRLGLHTEEDMDAIEDELAAADDADPRVGLLLAYDFTTWLQEGLSQSLLP